MDVIVEEWAVDYETGNWRCLINCKSIRPRTCRLSQNIACTNLCIVNSIFRNIQIIEGKIPPETDMDWVKEPLTRLRKYCDGESSNWRTVVEKSRPRDAQASSSAEEIFVEHHSVLR